jgi:hypothetical protein
VVTRGNDLLRKINDERNASVPLRFLVAAGEEAAEKRGQLEKLARRSVSMEARAFHRIKYLQPLEKPALHLGRAKAETVSDVVVEQHPRSGKRRRAR